MMLQEGQLLDGRYQIENMIGQGGMSYVYRAYDQKMCRTVAIKVLKEEYCEDEEFIRKFQNEAQAAAKLNHPNIVAAYDVVDDEKAKLHYIVMELVEGITLKNYIQRKGRLGNRETIGIALQVISGIEQAHKMNIVHRDIKPQNMIVGEDGVVKVADFGIARAATQQTVNATVMGSVHYISPEQARSGVSDERSDIYSFGCTMYEMLTGKVPYDGDTSVAVVFAHLKNKIPRVHDLVPDVYPALDMAVYKCMQKKSSLRYQHISDLGADLRMALKDPEGSFMNAAADEEALGETRVLTSDEMQELKEKRKSAPKIKEKETDLETKSEASVVKSISHINRAISIVCVLLILGIIGFLAIRIHGFFKESREITVTSAAESTAEVESASQEVNITISALEIRMPDILGMSVDEAEDYLSDYNMHIRTANEEYSDRYNEGLIISYPNKKYESGDVVDVTVSKGPATIIFYDKNKPDQLDGLHAMKLEDLEKELKDRNISYTVKTESSDTVATGYIIATNKPDTSGSEQLVITVSEGNNTKTVTVPNLLGNTEEGAAAALKQAGLKTGNITYQPDTSNPAGVVIHQSQAPGSPAEPDQMISFTVSSGPDGQSSVKAASSENEENGSQSYWYASINQAVTLGTGGPGIDGSMVVSIRLRQDHNGESYYTTLQGARSYPLGTELQVVFSSIKGEAGISSGTVEVVDAQNDTVIAEFPVTFAPES